MKGEKPKSILREIPWVTWGRVESNREFYQKLEQQRATEALLAQRPKISLVVNNGETKGLARLVASLLLQSYENWECLILSNSALPENVQTLVGDDSRIKIQEVTKADLATLYNAAIKHTNGDWIGFLESDQLLNPVALFEMIRGCHPKSSLLYVNEVGEKRAQSPLFYSKSAFSRFNLMHFNYIGKFWLTTRSTLEKTGEFKLNSPSFHHDWLLRAMQTGTHFQLVPTFALHHQDCLPKLAPSLSAPAVKKTIEAQLSTTLSQSNAEPRIVPLLNAGTQNKVSAIICFRDRPQWTIRCIRQLRDQIGQVPCEVILVDNQSKTKSREAVLSAAGDLQLDFKVLSFDEPFNFSRMNNLAVETMATGNFLLFLNNDVFWQQTQGLDEMVAWASLDWAGTVGIRLLFEDGQIQHGGFRAVDGGIHRIARIHHNQNPAEFLEQNREVFGNTFAACLVRLSVFQEVGGMNEIDFPNGYSDVAFNFECLKRGLHNLYLGHVTATHLESASRGLTYEYWEERRLEEKYAAILQKMLRYDLGYDRVPWRESSPKAALKTFLSTVLSQPLAELHERTPWLRKPLQRWFN